MAEQLDLCEKHFVGSYTGEDASECVVCSLQSELAERWENLNVQDGVIDGLREEIAALRERLTSYIEQISGLERIINAQAARVAALEKVAKLVLFYGTGHMEIRVALREAGYLKEEG